MFVCAYIWINVVKTEVSDDKGPGAGLVEKCYDLNIYSCLAILEHNFTK